jgi:hypothetical protein
MRSRNKERWVNVSGRGELDKKREGIGSEEGKFKIYRQFDKKLKL